MTLGLNFEAILDVFNAVSNSPSKARIDIDAGKKQYVFSEAYSRIEKGEE